MYDLNSIKSVKDFHNLDPIHLRQLASDIRKRIVEVVGKNGGHLSSNLGVVDLTIALHRVFISPQDAIVWDVGHQCYAHKIITGRNNLFDTLRKKDGLSGFPKSSESEHDFFNTGHASTSISAALGIAEAWKHLGKKNTVIAVIGDGALTGGMAFEAISQAGHSKLPLVVVLNDNKMSISKNVGAFSRYLTKLTASKRYEHFREFIDKIILHIPVFGKNINTMIYRTKRAIKGLLYKENIFSEFGFAYIGPIDGHNINYMMKIFQRAKVLARPVVVHVITKKGKGNTLAEKDPIAYHGVSPMHSPMRCTDGEIELQSEITYTEAFGQALVELGLKDKNIIAITAAMLTGTGLEPFSCLFPNRVYDVGIAESHATTFAAGLASQGLKPVLAIYSTFSQRAVDQIIHDIALQNLPVVIVLDRAGAVPNDGDTHQGIFDISIFRNLPNFIFLAPASAREVGLALNWALNSRRPCLLRYPKAICPKHLIEYESAYQEGRGVFVKKSGGKNLVLAMGSLVDNAIQAADILLQEFISRNIDPREEGLSVYNLRFISPIDVEYFLSIVEPYSRIFFIEEASVEGGLCEKLTVLINASYPNIRCSSMGFSNYPSDQASRQEILIQASLDPIGIAKKILGFILHDIDLADKSQRLMIK